MQLQNLALVQVAIQDSSKLQTLIKEANFKIDQTNSLPLVTNGTLAWTATKRSANSDMDMQCAIVITKPKIAKLQGPMRDNQDQPQSQQQWVTDHHLALADDHQYPLLFCQ